MHSNDRRPTLPDGLRPERGVRVLGVQVPPLPKPPEPSPPSGAQAPPGRPPPPSVAPETDAAIGRATRALGAKLLPAFAGTLLAGLVAGYIQFRAAMAETESLKVQVGVQNKTILELQADVAKLKVQDYNAAGYDGDNLAYLLAVLERTQGIKIRRPPGAPELPEIEMETPPLKRGRRIPAPPVTVKTEPPTPPTPPTPPKTP